PTGGTPVKLDFTGELMRASVADATVQLYQFVYLRGSLAFEKGASISWTEGNSTVSADAITIGASNVHVFVGIGGPYWKDSNNDGVINSSDTPDSDGAIGLALDSVNVGLALFKEDTIGGILARKYTSLKITAASAGMVGGGSFLTVD